MIKSILAVAVAGAFSATAFAALPNPNVATGSVADPAKINENFSSLDSSKLDKTTYNNNVLLVNSKLAEKVDTTTFETKLGEKVDTTTFETKLGEKVDQSVFDQKISEITDPDTGLIHNMAYSAADKRANEALDKAKVDATEKANKAEANAKEYTNTKATETLNSAKADATEKANKAEANAKEYTNMEVGAAKAELKGHMDRYQAATNAKFDAVNSRIDKLDDKMKKGFAAQAALNGLFQPYNVGKFNVSAAIGGYDSEQAMALGTGYRFNENFAIKAGIASDLSGFDHVTYNIGANFEF